jgi:O-antigen/teichoic acid export membrane protein
MHQLGTTSISHVAVVFEPERSCRMRQPASILDETVPAFSATELPTQRLRGLIGWTLVGNIAWAAGQWLLFVLLTRTGDPTGVGQFALALAVTTPIFVLANLQLRTLHVTDAQGHHEFTQYVSARVLTLIAALIAAALIGFIAYDAATARLIVVLGLARSVEAFSDTLYGAYQREEQMEAIAWSMAAKAAAGTVAFGLVLLAGGGLVAASVGLGSGYLLGILLVDRPLWKRRGFNQRYSWRFEPTAKTAKVIAQAAPLALAMFMLSLQANAPRFVIEATSGKAVLGIFAAVAQLMLPTTMLTAALGGSSLQRLAQHVAGGQAKQVDALMLRLIVMAALVGLSALLVAVAGGRLVLGLFYGAAYAAHAPILIVLTGAALLNAIANIFGTLASAGRRLREQMFIHAVALAIIVSIMPYAVRSAGVLGAAWATFLTSAFVLIAFGALAIDTRRRMGRRPTSTG